MEASIIIGKHREILKRVKEPPHSSLERWMSPMLNVTLILVICLFALCLLLLCSPKQNEIEKSIPSALLVEYPRKRINNNMPHKEYYYDYEPYLKNISLLPANKTRRFYYIDLGCFDGRDIDYFVHFHANQIAELGTLYIVAFEPDPINFSACKATQQRYDNIKGTVYDAAVWIDNGKVRYATEKGQKSRIDTNSALYVRSIDFSLWLKENLNLEDYVYVKFTIEGAEIPVLEKMIIDESISLVDHLEIEWNEEAAAGYEPRRIVLECMFDNFGMDFLYMINPVDARHAYNIKETYSAVPKDKGWKLKDSVTRFYYKVRRDVPELLIERLKQRQQVQ